eukprot:TRINITY_DN21253_c0_g1_i1.p1 TRINITY_DN21253_c0_g1~~TRINITY_DN21253_c0_g1_i1.p1  ORF type:complete len:871 (-),score=208.70 TRINITY_DN21253_c0_g1_i1:18-2630(-)
MATRLLAAEAKGEDFARAKRAKVGESLLGQEVIRRERHPEVAISLQVAASLQPDARARWLCRALEGVSSGVSRPSDLFDVVTHARFAAGVSGALAQRMLEELTKHASLFPEKLKQAILDGGFPLWDAANARAATASAKQGEKADPLAEAMLARCVDFVRRNESAIQAVHDLEERTFQVELNRSTRQQVWGITWVKAEFDARRRVVQAVVSGSPAHRWNEEDAKLGGKRLLKAGDELVAVNGLRSWEEMATIKDLLEARLTLVRPGSTVSEKADPSATAAGPGKDAGEMETGISPPAFEKGDYVLDASGSGWWGHSSGAWLYSKAEGIYFHSATGNLFMEDPAAPGKFLQVGGEGTSASSALAAQLAPPSRLRGCVRWFSRSKGFGFIAPAAAHGLKGSSGSSSDDIFLHRSELLPPASAEQGDAMPPLLPGMPVEFDLSVQENGKPCAVAVRQDTDLNALCRAGFSTGTSARCVDKAGIGLKAEDGFGVVGSFAGLVTGRHGMGGAEFVSLHLAKDLATSFQGREQGGSRGAKAALMACFQRTQHGFLQYAQRLSENSARLWLSAETSACSCLIFGPDQDGRPLVLVAGVGGGGHALVVRRDGTISARLGGKAGNAEDDKASKANHDSLKVFERGLKGPAIHFPEMYGSRQPRPRGFGGQARNDKDGAAAALVPEIHSCQLDWEEDVLMLLGSEALWSALPFSEEEAAKLALQALEGEVTPSGTTARAEEVAATRLAQEARGTKQGKALEDIAAAVLRFSWAQLGCTQAPAVASRPVAPAQQTDSSQDHQELDDMFAAPQSSEAPRPVEVASPESEAALEDGQPSSQVGDELPSQEAAEQAAEKGDESSRSASQTLLVRDTGSRRSKDPG